MCDDAEAAEPGNVLDDAGTVSSEWVRGRCRPNGDVMPPISADLDSVDAQHATEVLRGICDGCSIAVIREDDELQTGVACSRRHRCFVADAVRSRRVNMKRAARSASGEGWISSGRTPRIRWKVEEEQRNPGADDGQRQEATRSTC